LAELKKMRHERRDQLYGVVRDVMKRSEVLAPHYKFKVLSLDTQGSQFLVMIDVMSGPIMSAGTLTISKTCLATAAEDRHALRVKAVYWRQLRVLPVSGARGSCKPPSQQWCRHRWSQRVRAPAPVGRGGEKSQGFEPIGQDEMMAFKQAIASAVTVIAPVVSRVRASQAPRQVLKTPSYWMQMRVPHH
jgi:hypothetical protein